MQPFVSSCIRVVLKGASLVSLTLSLCFLAWDMTAEIWPFHWHPSFTIRCSPKLSQCNLSDGFLKEKQNKTK
jgi:hypothetical protein